MYLAVLARVFVRFRDSPAVRFKVDTRGGFVRPLQIRKRVLAGCGNDAWAHAPDAIIEPPNMRFFVGLHQPCDARHFAASFVSVNRLRTRQTDFEVKDWILDSGAFTEVARHGGYRFPVEEYAGHIRRWANCGNLLAAVAQDFMCESFILDRTGKSVEEHQWLTVERYDDLLRADAGVTQILPVLQGYSPESYLDHLRMYGGRLFKGMWVGVGSICKRNGDARAIENVLLGIKRERPDLRLHGFGLKTTALTSGLVRALLYSADSMAWSFAARIEGRNANDWREAARFVKRIETQSVQGILYAI